MPDAAAPQRGRWVLDQIDEIRRLGVEVDLFGFPPGRSEYLPADRRLRRLLRERRFDLVHAHYGLAGWCARLAGAAPLIVTFHGTDVRHHVVGPLSRRLAWRADLVAAVSRALFAPEDGRPGLPAVPGSAVLPCGPDLEPLPPDPARARRAASSASTPPAATSSSPPTRRGPRSAHDRAAELAAACGAELLTGGSIEPDRMPLWINAANAVLVTSDYEGFGMAASRRSPATCRSSPPRSGSPPTRSAGSTAASARRSTPAAWRERRRGRHLDAADPRVDGRRAGRLALGGADGRADDRAYRDVLDRTGRRVID